MKLKTFTLCLLIFLTAACKPDIDEKSPMFVANQFCKFLQAGDESALEKLLTIDLRGEIGVARQKDDVIRKTWTDEKPPLGDGIAYQAYVDHAPVCKPGILIGDVRDMQNTIAEIHHEFPDNLKTNWTDRLIMVNTKKGWKIDDVLFSNLDLKKGLRFFLHEAFVPYTPEDPAKAKNKQDDWDDTPRP